MRFHTMTPNDVKIVADNIDDFIEVPNGTERLRKSVLTLAVSGKLVPQNNTEGSVQTHLPDVHPDESFLIPKTWKWVQLDQIGSFGSGTGFPKEHQGEGEGEIPFFKVSDMNRNEKEMVHSVNWISRSLAKKIRANILPVGTIIFPKIGGAIATNKRRVLVRESCIDNNCLGFIPGKNTYGDWVFMLFTNIDLTKYQVGTSVPALNIGRLSTIQVALPPISEQKRIVKKVEELMKQLDELEAKKQERDETRTRLARSALQSLGKGESKVAFEYLTELIKNQDDIDELEKALRMLAVFGHLTSKTAEETDIPKSWKWTKWGDVLSDEKYSMKRGPFGSALRKDYFVPDGVMVYEQYNAIHDVDRARYFISDEKYKELEAFTVRPGDLIISCSGTLGRIAELHANSRVGIINQALLKIKLNSKVVLNDYFILLFRSDFIQDRIYLEALGTAMTNMVNVKTLKTILLPIPPISEQKRIVKKVEEVTVLINRLKQVIGEK